MNSPLTDILCPVEGRNPIPLKPLPLGHLAAEPLVSVLASNYNYAHFAPEAIESVLSQTYPHFELIICDDGSTDNSREVIERYATKDPRIKLLTKANGGQASGFNLAFTHSRGEIVCFLDTDDLYTPDKLERVVRQYHSSPEAGCVIHRWMCIDSARASLGERPLLEKLPSGWQGPHVLENGGLLPDIPPTIGLSFRREIAEWMFPLPVRPPLNMCPDQVMMRIGPLVTPIAAIQQPLAEVRIHQDNTYQRRQLSPATIARELGICESVWSEQGARLNGMAPGLAELLSPLESDLGIVMQRYVLARLTDDPASGALHRQLMDLWQNREARRYYRWYWALSRYLPDSLFEWSYNLLVTQNRWKNAASRFVRFLRLLR